jgi:GWxTD domain-containing protein
MALRSALRQSFLHLLVLSALLSACHAGAPPFSGTNPPNAPPADSAAKAAAAVAPAGPPSGLPGGTEGFGLYRQGGLLAQAGPIPFVGSVRFFAGPTDDSTLVLVALSLANRSFLFAPQGSEERAVFAVAITARDSTNPIIRVENQQYIRVKTFKETARADESVVYERYITLRPGTYTLGVTVSDRSTANSTTGSLTITVPALSNGALSSPVTVHTATARDRRDTLPNLIANPRSTLVFGKDSLASVYLEAYGLPAGSRIALSVLTQDRSPLLRDTVTLTRGLPLAGAVFGLPMARLGLGRRIVEATVVGSRDTVRTPIWITVGEGMGIVSFEELLSYLRYFATAQRLQALRDTPPEQRAAAWAAFWKETDPNPATIENEALVDYFERIQTANRQFKEPGEPGWLTDRGKVYITLGEPDQVTGQDGRGLTPSGRSQYWAYARHGVRLEFVDQNGFGRWRLTPRSEADFSNIAAQERVH